jgi:hypothetical protein
MPEWIQEEITPGNGSTARALNAWALTGMMPGPHAPQSYAELYVLQASIHSEAADVGVQHALPRAIKSRSYTPCPLPLALTLPDYPVALPDYVDLPSDYAPCTPTTASTAPTISTATTLVSVVPPGWTPTQVSPVSRSGWTNVSTPDIAVPPPQEGWTQVGANGWLRGQGTSEDPIVVTHPPLMSPSLISTPVTPTPSVGTARSGATPACSPHAAMGRRLRLGSASDAARSAATALCPAWMLPSFEGT